MDRDGLGPQSRLGHRFFARVTKSFFVYGMLDG